MKDYIILPEGTQCPYYKWCVHSNYKNDFLRCWGSIKYRGSKIYTCNLKLLRENVKNNKTN